MTKELERLQNKQWKNWGPYLSERQWGTVREDYSEYGAAWEYFPHDHARSRAYRWGEDGIAGICDSQQQLCLAIALWNEQDPILKERLFGLTDNQGNHGEDVKEYYFYIQAKYELGDRWLYCDGVAASNLLFTENETNDQRLFTDNNSPYVKDGINNYVVHGDKDAVNSRSLGTKFLPHYVLN